MTRTLVWVHFMGILPEFIDEETIAFMGDMVGRTVKVDDLSLTGKRDRFARCCIEIDLSASLVLSIIMFDFAQQVEYEGPFNMF